MKSTEPQEVIVAGSFEVLVEPPGLDILAAGFEMLAGPIALVVLVLVCVDTEVELEVVEEDEAPQLVDEVRKLEMVSTYNYLPRHSERVRILEESKIDIVLWTASSKT